MSRGRPKGSKNKIKKIENEVLFSTEEQPQEVKTTTDDKKPSKPLKVVCTCDLCGSDIYSSPYIARLQEMSGRAYWHRDCNQDSLRLCKDCSSELSSVIDKFLIEKNPNLSKTKV